jgi:membrane fusion protein (multidrug efflux system)
MVLLLAGCNKSDTAQAGAPDATPPPVAVVVAKTVRKTVPIVGEYIARTTALATVDIKARVTGVLTSTSFEEGQLVKRGQLLFTIAPDEYAASLQSSRALLAKAQADLNRAVSDRSPEIKRAQLTQEEADLQSAVRKLARYRPLAAERAVTQVDLDEADAAEQVARSKVTAAQEFVTDADVAKRIGIQQARAIVEQNEAAVKKDEIRLSYTQIRAPVTGLIGFVKVDKGNVVGPDSPALATISTLNPMGVQFALTELDYLNLVHRLQAAKETNAPDLPLELILSDNSTYPFKGRPKVLDRAVDPKTGTIAVLGEFPNPPGSLDILRPGLFGRVRIVLGFHRDAVLVPQRAVVQLQGSDTVYVVGADNKVALRSVRLGQRTGTDYVVDSGLQAGETVVLEGTQKVQPGGSVVATAPASSEKERGPVFHPPARRCHRRIDLAHHRRGHRSAHPADRDVPGHRTADDFGHGDISRRQRRHRRTVGGRRHRKVAQRRRRTALHLVPERQRRLLFAHGNLHVRHRRRSRRDQRAESGQRGRRLAARRRRARGRDRQ